jgi:hypothetical protein
VNAATVKSVAHSLTQLFTMLVGMPPPGHQRADLEEVSKHNRMPTLALTASGLLEDTDCTSMAGCEYHLVKRLKKVTLIDTISAIQVLLNPGLLVSNWKY